MIELISDTRCIACDICVKICPTNVFDGGSGQAPTIARQQDCQTCFMCEAYCPADAIYVAPESARAVAVNE
jgi:NAD-dependent dihydropyrimidine dehydrogenase PreA subunit